MRFNVCLVFAFALLCLAALSVNGATLEQSTLLQASFGDGADQYGFQGIANEREIPIRVVSSFDVAPTGIYIFDSVKSDIKVYGPTGLYRRTITPLWRIGDVARPVRADDILVDGDQIHLLVDWWLRPDDPDIEWSRFQVFTVDRQTGKVLERRFVKHPDVGTYVSSQDGERHEMNGSVQLGRQGDAIVLYDHYQQLSYAVASARKSANDPEIAPVAGVHQIRKNTTEDTVELVDVSGNALQTLSGRGSLLAIASDTDRYMTSRSDADRGHVITAHSVSGGVIAEAVVPSRGAWSENPGSAWQTFELHGSLMYEVVVSDAGVQIVQWRVGGGSR